MLLGLHILADIIPTEFSVILIQGFEPRWVNVDHILLMNPNKIPSPGLIIARWKPSIVEPRSNLKTRLRNVDKTTISHELNQSKLIFMFPCDSKRNHEAITETTQITAKNKKKTPKKTQPN